MEDTLIKSLTEAIVTKKIAMNITVSQKSAKYLADVVDALQRRNINASRSAAVDQIVLWAAAQVPAETLASQPESTPNSR